MNDYLIAEREANLFPETFFGGDTPDHELFEHQSAQSQIPYPAADTVATELAVSPFASLDRNLMFGAFLSVADNKTKTAKNNAAFAKFGIPFSDFKARLNQYVNLAIIERLYKHLYPNDPIGATPDQFNAVITEGVHQFQLKCCCDTGDCDAEIGDSTLDSMGFVFHTGRKSFSPKRSVHSDLKSNTSKIAQYAAGQPLPYLQGINGRNWFDYRGNPTVFGWRGNRGSGYHDFYILELRKAENILFNTYKAQLHTAFIQHILWQHNTELFNLYGITKSGVQIATRNRFLGQVPRLLGEALGIIEHHKDMRPHDGKSSKSFHYTGLAIDINYDRNPWVKDGTGLDHLKISNSSISTRKSTAQQYFEEIALQLKNTADIYDYLVQLNANYVSYFNQNYRRDPHSKISYLQRNEGTYRDPRNGFLYLNKDMVVTLRDTLSLAWGAVDFGPTSDGNGDMMHFDMRPTDVGALYRRHSDSLKKVHPRFASVAATPAAELFEGEAGASGFWFDQLIGTLSRFAFWASKGAVMLPYLISLYHKGEKDPNKLTDRLYLNVLYPSGTTPVKAHWSALYNFLVTPFLLLSGRAVKTLQNNLILPNPGSTPFILAKNEYGMVLFPNSGSGFARYATRNDDSYTHPVTGKTGRHGDAWVDPQTGADFFNAIQDFRATPEGQNVTIRYDDISAYDPAINLGHQTHNRGKAIDVHYFGSTGEELSGESAYRNGDVVKMNAFFAIAQQYGFNTIYTYGRRFTHRGDNNKSNHLNHFHMTHV